MGTSQDWKTSKNGNCPCCRVSKILCGNSSIQNDYAGNHPLANHSQIIRVFHLVGDACAENIPKDGGRAYPPIRYNLIMAHMLTHRCPYAKLQKQIARLCDFGTIVWDDTE